MKKLKFTGWIITVVLLVIGFFSGLLWAFSGGSGEEPEDLPPKGLAISEDAPGIKLTGVLVTEYIYLDEETPSGKDFADMARVVLRLHKGNEMKIFYDEVPGPMSPMADPLGVQMLIMGKMMDTVVGAFFPGVEAEAKVKSITNFAHVYGNVFLPRDNFHSGYNACEVKTVLTCDTYNPACDPGDASLYIDILSCDGDYELCGNGIDDDGDLKLDGTGYPYLWDDDCAIKNGFIVTDIDLSVK